VISGTGWGTDISSPQFRPTTLNYRWPGVSSVRNYATFPYLSYIYGVLRKLKIRRTLSVIRFFDPARTSCWTGLFGRVELPRIECTTFRTIYSVTRVLYTTGTVISCSINFSLIGHGWRQV